MLRCIMLVALATLTGCAAFVGQQKPTAAPARRRNRLLQQNVFINEINGIPQLFLQRLLLQ